MRDDATLISLLSDVPAAEIHAYGVRDDGGRSLDCLKIQQASGRYLGVSHVDDRGSFAVDLSASEDLVTWSHVRRLSDDASQPTLEPDGAGGWLYADEVMDAANGNLLRFRHYASTDALLGGEHDREIAPPNTLARPGNAQGTPHLLPPDPPFDPDRSGIEVGFHYFARRDLQAEGVLTGFASWRAWARPDLDALFPDAEGNVGDRDAFRFAGRSFVLHEVQDRAEDWGSWRLWLRDPDDDTVVPVPLRTHGGSASPGNPTVTRITLPDGRPGLVVTCYIFSPGAAPGEQGTLVFAKPFPMGV